MIPFIPMIKQAVAQFYHSRPTYSDETIVHVKNMLTHLKERSDPVDALDQTYGLLEKLKASKAPQALIEMAENNYHQLEKILDCF